MSPTGKPELAIGSEIDGQSSRLAIRGLRSRSPLARWNAASSRTSASSGATIGTVGSAKGSLSDMRVYRLQHTVGINSFVTRSWHFCKVKTCDFINPARRTRVWRPAQLGRSLDDEIEPAKGLARHNRRLAVQDFPRSHEAEVFTKHHSLMSTSSQIEREVTGGARVASTDRVGCLTSRNVRLSDAMPPARHRPRPADGRSG